MMTWSEQSWLAHDSVAVAGDDVFSGEGVITVTGNDFDSWMVCSLLGCESRDCKDVEASLPGSILITLGFDGYICCFGLMEMVDLAQCQKQVTVMEVMIPPAVR